MIFRSTCKDLCSIPNTNGWSFLQLYSDSPNNQISWCCDTPKKQPKKAIHTISELNWIKCRQEKLHPFLFTFILKIYAKFKRKIWVERKLSLPERNMNISGFNIIIHRDRHTHTHTHRNLVCSSSGTLRLVKVSFHWGGHTKNPFFLRKRFVQTIFSHKVCVCTYINCCQCVGVCMYVYVMYVYVCVCVGVHLCGSVYKCVCPVAISGSAPFSTFPGNLFPWRFVYGYKELPESEARDYSRHSLTTTAKFNWIFYLLSIFTTQILANLHLKYLI